MKRIPPPLVSAKTRCKTHRNPGFLCQSPNGVPFSCRGSLWFDIRFETYSPLGGGNSHVFLFLPPRGNDPNIFQITWNHHWIETYSPNVCNFIYTSLTFDKHIPISSPGCGAVLFNKPMSFWNALGVVWKPLQNSLQTGVWWCIPYWIFRLLGCFFGFWGV